jgi:hypothetical protein
LITEKAILLLKNHCCIVPSSHHSLSWSLVLIQHFVHYARFIHQKWSNLREHRALRHLPLSASKTQCSIFIWEKKKNKCVPQTLDLSIKLILPNYLLWKHAWQNIVESLICIYFPFFFAQVAQTMWLAYNAIKLKKN